MLSNQAGGEKRDSLHGHWSSRMAFILAVTGIRPCLPGVRNRYRHAGDDVRNFDWPARTT